MTQTFYHRLYALWMREGLGGIVRYLLRRTSLRQRFVARYAPKAGPGLEIGPVSTRWHARLTVFASISWITPMHRACARSTGTRA